MDLKRRKMNISVMIPTFNRKEKLSKTLDILSNQTYKDFQVVISDNHSDYSIEEEILKKYDNSFRDKVTVLHNSNNIGASLNMANLLTFCKTEWAWLLGDDDIIFENSVENIIRTIRDNEDVSAIWFSIRKSDCDEIIIRSLEDYVDQFWTDLNVGDVLFISNKVFRVCDANRYLDTMYTHMDSAVPYLFPLFELLKNNHGICIVYGNLIAEHPGFESGVTWNFNTVSLAMKEIINYDTGLSWKNQKKFAQTVMFDWKKVIVYYLTNKSIPYNYRTYLMSLYYGFYRFVKPLHKRAVIWVIYKILCVKFFYNIAVCEYTKQNM